MLILFKDNGKIGDIKRVGVRCMKKIINMFKNVQFLSAMGAFTIGIGIIYACISVDGNEKKETMATEATSTISEESTVIETTSLTETSTIEIVSETQTETTTVEQVTTLETTTVAVATQKKTTNQKTTKKQQATKATENPTKFINADISAFINKSSNTVRGRFKTPAGFTRLEYEEGSFAEYVRNQPLEPHGTKLYEFDGKLAENQTWFAAIIKTDFHKRGWLQCADCVIKLVSDYLYKNNRKSEIVFNLANGDRMAYSKWRGSYQDYLTEVYYLANTASLMDQKESKRLSLDQIHPGAYFIMAKDSAHEYGHAVYVIDVAKNYQTGEIAFLLAQGSTPSQSMNIFLNPLHINDPWYYSSEIGSTFAIPFWNFDTRNLYYYEAIGIQKPIVKVEPTTTAVEITEENTTTVKTEPDTTTTVEVTPTVTTTETTTSATISSQESTSGNDEETTSVGENQGSDETTETTEPTDLGE